MEIKIETVGAGAAVDLPRRFPAQEPTPPALPLLALGQGKVKTNEIVEGPDQGDDAQQPDAPVVDAANLRNMQAEVQLVEKRHKGFPGDGPHLAPFPGTLDIPAHRVDVNLVEAGLVETPGLRVNPRTHPEILAVAGFGVKLEVGYLHLGKARFHPLRQ